MCTGYLLLALLATLGLAAMIAASPILFELIRRVGAAHAADTKVNRVDAGGRPLYCALRTVAGRRVMSDKRPLAVLPSAERRRSSKTPAGGKPAGQSCKKAIALEVQSRSCSARSLTWSIKALARWPRPSSAPSSTAWLWNAALFNTVLIWLASWSRSPVISPIRFK